MKSDKSVYLLFTIINSVVNIFATVAHHKKDINLCNPSQITELHVLKKFFWNFKSFVGF
jgi:hypothetical protein